MKKIVLIDGNSLLFKAFYATFYTGAWMKTSTGFPTNALYGFSNMMYNLLNQIEYSKLLVAFDTGKPTFRHTQFEDYKGTRGAAPEELKLQFPKVYELLDMMGIKWYAQEGIEADDIIGTLAREYDAKGYEVAIYTSDKDLLQLATDNITVCLTKKGISEIDYMTPDAIKEKFGLDPIRIIDLKGLMGDASDNIPGVKGVGEKTAVKLLSEYESLENVYENLDKLKGALLTKLTSDKDNAFLSKELATIKIDCDVNLCDDDLCFTGIDMDGFKEFLEEYEMTSLLRRLG